MIRFVSVRLCKLVTQKTGESSRIWGSDGEDTDADTTATILPGFCGLMKAFKR